MLFSMIEYFKYMNGNENSRSIYEGEHVVNAGHVILCGVTNLKSDCVNIYALCLQTSALQSTPHIIEGVFRVHTDGLSNVQNITCSCKAGKGGRCKHISAVLILCTR